MIAHPPCTYLAVSGARWWKDRREEQQAAVDFVFKLLEAPIERIAIENPVGCLPKFIGEWDQMIEPRQFGEKVSKATCLWLKGLPTLRATNKVSVLEVQDTIHREPPGPERWKNRSRTFLGVAAAMAQQWGVA